MEKKKTEKALSKTTTSTEKKVAKVSENGMVDVVVTAKFFGTRKKGDVMSMHITTANACVKKGAVKFK